MAEVRITKGLRYTDRFRDRYEFLNDSVPYKVKLLGVEEEEFDLSLAETEEVFAHLVEVGYIVLGGNDDNG